MDPYKTNGLMSSGQLAEVERDAEIPSLLRDQRAHLEELSVVITRLTERLEPVMTGMPPEPTNKASLSSSRPITTSMGTLLDSSNQDLASQNRRIRTLIERLAI